ncbi:MAG: CheR family methyltransferase [Gemmatimonadaceae bacterium]
MISAEDYSFLSALLRRNSGLALGAGKEYLLESRLPPVALTYGFSSLVELVAVLRARPHAELVKAVCDAMTTGETFFFRDTVPFDVMRTVMLPDLAERCRKSGRPLRIWCAAASTGQEPYSVAMMIAEASGLLAGVRIDVIATDYAAHVLNRARRGTYTQMEVQRGLPDRLLRKYFTEDQDGFHIVDEIRRRVTFRELNLTESFRSMGQFDMIICRNVLIYFDTETKKDVLDRLATTLAPGGYLFLGSTETAYGLTERLGRLSAIPTSVHMRREDIASVELKVLEGGPMIPAA